MGVRRGLDELLRNRISPDEYRLSETPVEHAFHAWPVHEAATFADRGHGLSHADHSPCMTPTDFQNLFSRLATPYKAHMGLLSKQRTEGEHTPMEEKGNTYVNEPDAFASGSSSQVYCTALS